MNLNQRNHHVDKRPKHDPDLLLKQQITKDTDQVRLIVSEIGHHVREGRWEDAASACNRLQSVAGDVCFGCFMKAGGDSDTPEWLDN